MFQLGAISNKIHSKYTRKIFNGSLYGSSQEIILVVWKFRCKEVSCSQKIFSERFSFINSYTRLPNNIKGFKKGVAGLQLQSTLPVKGVTMTSFEDVHDMLT